MDYEQKYKRALAWMQSLYPWLHGNTREEAEKYFPELAESEDERIRKELIHYFSDGVEFLSLCSFSREEIIAWLEKQDDKKPTDKVKPKFNIGDIIFNKKTKEQFTITGRSLALQYYHDEDHLHEVRFSEQDEWEIIKPKFHEGNWVFIEEVDGHKQGPFQIKEITQYGYTFFNERRVMPFECESLMTLWAIADAKGGDVLCTNNDNLFIFKEEKDGAIYDYCGFYNGHLYEKSGSVNGTAAKYSYDGYRPATKEQRDLLFSKMREAGYEWDAEKKELKKIEQQPAESRQETKPNGGIVCEDFNEGDGCYKVNLAYLSKSQVELIENLVASWQNPTNNTAVYGEEDKKKLNRIYTLLAEAADKHAFSKTCRLIGDKECVELQDFLRSLRPQASKR